MYWFFVYLFRGLTWLASGIEVSGLEHIPAQGGAVVAGHHTTWFDPFAIAVALHRPVHFMAKAELFKNPILRFLLSGCHVFPVRRGLADREAIRTAQKRVSGGNLLGIFPEGTRSPGPDELLPLQGGAAMLALRTGVPVIPVVVTDVESFRWRRPIKVHFGPPIDLGGPVRTNRTSVAAANETISSQLSLLLNRN